MNAHAKPAPRVKAARQRSHLLFVMTGPAGDATGDFEAWFAGEFRSAIESDPRVLGVSHLRQADLDVTGGRHMPIPYRYLAIYDLVLDGAEEAEPLIEEVLRRHAAAPSAAEPGTWLYYPVSEPAGDLAADGGWVTIAFANPAPGTEPEFREFYATRHTRHALNIPALARGQCFARTVFQRPGAWDGGFEVIAVYEQVAPPEAILDGFKTLPPGTIDFPALDRARGRFMEASYEKLAVRPGKTTSQPATEIAPA